MLPGRKPKPTHLKILSGNPGGRPLNVDEPVPEGELLAPPDWFTAGQKEVWRRTLENSPKGLLRSLDQELLTAFVVAADMHREATKKVKELGMLVRSPRSGVPVQNPYLPIINRQAEIMRKAASELGLPPTARSRVNFGGSSSAKTKNKFASNAARRTGTGGSSS